MVKVRVGREGRTLQIAWPLSFSGINTEIIIERTLRPAAAAACVYYLSLSVSQVRISRCEMHTGLRTNSPTPLGVHRS